MSHDDQLRAFKFIRFLLSVVSSFIFLLRSTAIATVDTATACFATTVFAFLSSLLKVVGLCFADPYFTISTIAKLRLGPELTIIACTILTEAVGTISPFLSSFIVRQKLVTQQSFISIIRLLLIFASLLAVV